MHRFDELPRYVGFSELLFQNIASLANGHH